MKDYYYRAEIREMVDKQWAVVILKSGKVVSIKGLNYYGIYSLMGARRVGVRELHKLGVARPVVKVIRLKK